MALKIIQYYIKKLYSILIYLTEKRLHWCKKKKKEREGEMHLKSIILLELINGSQSNSLYFTQYFGQE